jgi:hypothetical protein
MPSTKAKKAASANGKEAIRRSPKKLPCRRPRVVLALGKGPAISKIDDDEDAFMPSTKAKKAPSTKGKRVA